jgi:DNA-damage-inducible protein J
MAMPTTTNLSVRINRDLKEEADQIFNSLGMSMSTAITIFVRQVVRQKKIPFEIALSPDGGINSAAMRDLVAASESIWQNSLRIGTDKMTMDEIDAEIKAARAEKKAVGQSV